MKIESFVLREVDFDYFTIIPGPLHQIARNTDFGKKRLKKRPARVKSRTIALGTDSVEK
jgi:hypothetical protein